MVDVLNVKKNGKRAVETTLSVDCKIFVFRLEKGKAVAVSKEAGAVPKLEMRDAYAVAYKILKPRD